MKQAFFHVGLGLILALVVLGYLAYDRGYVPDSVLALTRADQVAEVRATPRRPLAGPALFTCPMHPHYIATDPDGTCPICGMDLVPAQSDAGGGPDDGTVAVAPEMIQTMGVRTAPVEHAPFMRTGARVRQRRHR